MSADDLRIALAALGMSQRGFAAFVDANERTIRRWATGEQDIPGWVPVMLRLLRETALSPDPVYQQAQQGDDQRRRGAAQR